MSKTSALTRNDILELRKSLTQVAITLQQIRQTLESLQVKTQRLKVEKGTNILDIDLSGTNPQVSISSAVRTALRTALGI